MKVLVSVFEECHFDLVILAIEFNLINLLSRQFDRELVTRLRAPPPKLCV